ARPLPPGFGSLSQNDLALRVRNDALEIRFVPLDPAITPLLARDAYQSLRNLVQTHRRGIDSVAARAGVAQPGLALVTFFGQRPDVRFDPQTLTLLVRNRLFRPLGLIPLSPKFTSQQLGVREQASAIYVFEQEIPVDESFTMSYAELVSEDWQGKQSLLDRERGRVAARARSERRDTAR
ncbi:MAG TPA: hypothetical protein VD930_03600, partial [Gemmatimonadales bacterium]|nr:hypothetical protein [Gemmatimonadales bacterium]